MKPFERFQSRSIRYLMKMVFTTIIVSFALVSGMSLLYLHSVSSEYDRQINNIERANDVSQIAKEEIGRESFRLLSGRVTLEQSKSMEVLESIESELNVLYLRAAGDAGWEFIEAALRGSGTLRQYVERLHEQTATQESVFAAQRTLDEINQVATNIYDALQEFIYLQTKSIAAANNAMQSTTKWMLAFIAILSAGIIVLVLFAYGTLKRAADRPATELAAMAERILRGDLETQVPPPGLEELNRVTESINLMGGRIRTLLDERIYEQQNLKKAEIRTLQAQITPHFLYNTLDTIVWLAEGGYNEKVVEVTMAFSHFYRVALSSGRDFIRVAEEVKHIEDYLVIQSVRYQNILRYEINVEEGLLERSMLKLLLQPLVENALYHGLKNKRGGGLIRITGEDTPKGMLFAVEDDGIGMSELQVEQLERSILREDPPETSGYGLYNVNRRIRLYYGTGGLKIESEFKKGTKISFRLPARQQEE